MAYDVLVIGASAGGIDALKQILGTFSAYEAVACIIVQHLSPNNPSYMKHIVSDASKRQAIEIEDKTEIIRGGIYLVPPNYHVLVEKTGYFTLSVSEKVCFARPSIDVTFESAADAYGEGCIGVLLTGANQDGGMGLKAIKEAGGYTIVQDPQTAEAVEMPLAGIKYAQPHEVIALNHIGKRLNEILKTENKPQKWS